MLRRNRTRGQAIVEFALAATLIFFLLAAAVDIGLIFFALQGLHNAAQEGATFGSRWLLTDATGARLLDVARIKDHVRHESGNKGGVGFVNLLDLNGDGVDDSTQAGVVDANISVEMLSDPTADGDPTKDVATGAAENVACPDASTAVFPCYIRVTVASVHNMLFPLAPAFSKVVPLKSSYIMPIRDSMARGTGGAFTPSQTCTVPTLIGNFKNNAAALWAGAGFSGTLTTAPPSSNYTINSQTLGAGTTQLCTSAITVGP